VRPGRTRVLHADKFISHCLDNPNDKALAAFEKIGN
jgi:hypothetical protein